MIFMSSRLIPTGVAASAVSVSTATLTRWAARGDVTPAQVTVGGHYRWNLASLRAQVRKLRTGEHDIQAEEIARVIHAANRELQIVQGDPVPSPPWDEAPDYQAQQAVAGVQAVINDPDLTAERHHQMWVERMQAAGWTYGQVKDEHSRTHPTLLPWGALPAEQQLKDRLFIAIVRALTAM